MKLRFILLPSSLSKWYYFIIIGLPIIFPLLLLQEEVPDPSLAQANGFAEIILVFFTLLIFSFIFWFFLYTWKMYPLKNVSLSALFPPHFIVLKAVLFAFFTYSFYFFGKYSILLFQAEGLHWWEYLITWLIMWGLLTEVYLYLNGLAALIIAKSQESAWLKHIGFLALFLVFLPMVSATVILIVLGRYL